MKIPEKIVRNRKTYILVKQVNKKLFLYEQKGTGFNECFSLYDLGCIQKRKTEYKLRPELFKFL